MKKKTLGFAAALIICFSANSQTIYSISEAGESVLEALDRMVNEHRLPTKGTNSTYQNSTSDPINVTVATTHSNDITVSVAYDDVPKEAYGNTPNLAPGPCSTAAATMTHYTISLSRYRAQGSTAADTYAKLIWSEDPATVPSTGTPFGYSWGPYYIYLHNKYNINTTGHYLDPINAVGHHTFPLAQACGPTLRNHLFHLWLIDDAGNNLSFGDVSDIISYELESDGSNLPVSCASDPSLNSVLAKLATPTTGFADVNIPNGIRLRVKLFNGNEEKVHMFVNYSNMVWKNAYEPCDVNEDLDCKYISTLFHDMNPEVVDFIGPSNKTLNTIGVNAIEYHWHIAGNNYFTRNELLENTINSAQGHHSVELILNYVKYQDDCYHTAFVNNDIYFPGTSCNNPVPPVQSPPSGNGPLHPNFENTFESGIDNNSIIHLYPNPSNELVMIKGLLNGEASISVIDLSGKLVKTYSGLVNEEFAFDISDINHGAYILQIIQNGKTSSLKLMKE